MLKGGKHGAAATPGKAGESNLIKRLVTTDPDEVMPPEGDRLTAAEVALLSRWVDEGMKWDEATTVQAATRPTALLRRPPVAAGEGNGVDRYLRGYFERTKFAPGAAVDDRTFARRVYLDLVGVLPTPAELDAFLNDKESDPAGVGVGADSKRVRLVKALLADDERYANHWITFWQDLLRDGRMDLGTTDVFRPITPWLLKALKTNLRYDEFARQLIDPVVPAEFATIDAKTPDRDDAPLVEKEAKLTDADSFGFIQGVRGGLEKPRGDQRWEVQAVQNISQVFLGLNLKCATCHDSFLDSWKMTEVWGLASVYSAKPLEVVRCEVPQGVHPKAAFVFPELGQIDASASVDVRRRQLAELTASAKNGRFARTIVNRLWRQVMGRGIVEPVDEVDAAAPFDQDLLDYLACELVDNHFDLKHVIGLIVSSRAYQLPAVDDSKTEAGAPFRGPLLRRMSAEQFVDAVSALQGKGGRAWTRKGGRLLEILGRPDRLTVTTAREQKASPMQALELLNGAPLFEEIYLEVGPPAPRTTDDKKRKQLEAVRPKANPRLAKLAALGGRELVTTLYAHGLSRSPTDSELKLYLEMLGERPTPDAVADVLWIVSMLPEFQLIR